MNCRDAEPYLELLGLDLLGRPSTAVGIPDRVALNEHVSNCPSCLRTARSLAEWDRQLGRCMSEVVTPEELTQRLLNALPQELPAVAAPTASRSLQSHRSRTWRRSITAASVFCLMIAAVLWARHALQPTLLNSANFAELLRHSSDELPPWQANDDLSPQQWNSLRRDMIIDGWKRGDVKSLGITFAVCRIEVRTNPGQSIEGNLFAIPNARWSPAPSTVFSQSVIQYSPPNVWVVWTEREIVYILSLNGSAQTLERIQRQLDGQHAVL